MFLNNTTGDVKMFVSVCVTAASHTVLCEGVLRRPFPLNAWFAPRCCMCLLTVCHSFLEPDISKNHCATFVNKDFSKTTKPRQFKRILISCHVYMIWGPYTS